MFCWKLLVNYIKIIKIYYVENKFNGCHDKTKYLIIKPKISNYKLYLNFKRYYWSTELFWVLL